MSVCLSVGNAFSHFSDFDDATALLRYPPTRMGSSPISFFVSFHFFRIHFIISAFSFFIFYPRFQAIFESFFILFL